MNPDPSPFSFGRSHSSFDTGGTPALLGLVLACSLAFGGFAAATETDSDPIDPGKQTIGTLEISVLLATDKDPDVAGENAPPLDTATAARLQREKRLFFTHYRLLGKTTTPIYRSYENWAEPLKPSDEVLIRFEAQARPTAKALRLDIELWLSRKKILKTDTVLTADRPIYILGPEWRGGRLIVAIALAQTGKPGQ